MTLDLCPVARYQWPSPRGFGYPRPLCTPSPGFPFTHQQWGQRRGPTMGMEEGTLESTFGQSSESPLELLLWQEYWTVLKEPLLNP